MKLKGTAVLDIIIWTNVNSLATAQVGTHGKRSFKYNACKMWNELPVLIKTAETKTPLKLFVRNIY